MQHLHCRQVLLCLSWPLTTAAPCPRRPLQVELTEMPFVVVPLEDIEIINLERVGFNLKNFDMAIVFKVGRGVCCAVLRCKLCRQL